MLQSFMDGTGNDPMLASVISSQPGALDATQAVFLSVIARPVTRLRQTVRTLGCHSGYSASTPHRDGRLDLEAKNCQATAIIRRQW
jgi:hypothetical protein